VSAAVNVAAPAPTNVAARRALTSLLRLSSGSENEGRLRSRAACGYAHALPPPADQQAALQYAGRLGRLVSLRDHALPESEAH
jgi:hypothetical protein